MSARNDGGAAFPTVIASPDHFPDGATLPLGMSLRDWFAGQAITGLLANSAELTFPEEPSPSVLLRALGVSAYEIADAMIEQRKE